MYLKLSTMGKYWSILTLIFFISCLVFTLSQDLSLIISTPLMSLSTGSLFLSILVDKISMLFSATVSLISLSVFTYSFEYMKDQKFFARFHLLLFLFVLSMVFLILSPNLIFSMLGWDGLGVTSYLLVIYYNNNKSNGAGMVTALVNRFGDFMLIMAILHILFSSFDNFLLYKFWQEDSSLWTMLAVGAFTKSAQIPFSAWLPAAMAAPTPVSSLVHSSTLVTAGVYILIRHVEGLPIYLATWIFLIGTATMTMASVSALNEKDMKKMVALSTLSQLGLMMMSVGMLWSLMAFMHLIIHAFFKALMFMSTGNLIHFNSNYQSLMKAGGFLFSSPINSSITLVSSMSLMGAPFAAAFFSKEPILEMSMTMESNMLMSLLAFISVFLTGAYSMRFVGMVLSLNSKNVTFFHLEEGGALSLMPLLIMFIPAFTGGSLVSSMISNQPSAFFYPLMVKGVILTLVLVSYVVSLTLDNAFFVKLGEYSVFSMWSLAGFTSSMFNYTAHQGSKLVLLYQADSVNISANLSGVNLSSLYMSFLMNTKNASSLLLSLILLVILVLMIK